LRVRRLDAALQAFEHAGLHVVVEQFARPTFQDRAIGHKALKIGRIALKHRRREALFPPSSRTMFVRQKRLLLD